MYCLKFLLLASISMPLRSSASLEHRVEQRQSPCSSTSVPLSSSPSPIQSSQNVTAPGFIGSPVEANQLQPKVRFIPDASLMHQDAGNTGSVDCSAPLGTKLNVSSAAETAALFLQGSDGSVTSAYATISNGSIEYQLAALDSLSLQVLATWSLPYANQTPQYAYMEIVLSSNTIVLPTKQGFIYVISRDDCNGIPSFTTLRTIDIRSSILPGELLLNSLLDAEGNIWFTTGGIVGSGDPSQTTCTIGYVSPDSSVHAKHFEDQMVENGIALNGTSIYVVLGPSGPAFNQTNATGHMYAFTTASNATDSVSSENITTLWSAPYSAGSELKPGGFARGSGSTPGLLGNHYVAITDNSDEQINLIVYNREPSNTSTSPSSQVHCTIPLFRPNASANEIALATHQEISSGTVMYGVAIENAAGFPPVYRPGIDEINGAFNNMSSEAPGVARIDVSANGCKLRWETEVRIKSVPVLSTATGLYYGYTQDEELALKGEYAWYAVALDWESGKEVWRVKAGAGGTFNDNFYPAAITREGDFWQAVLGGVVVVRDGGR